MNEIINYENVDFYKLYKYTEIDCFMRHPRNRVVDYKLVKKYKKGMLDGTSSEALIGNITIDVKTKLIYDGQHRLQAFKEAKAEGYEKPILVRYIDAPETEEEQIKLINDLNNGKHWNINDHINSHMTGENDLQKLNEFCLSHKRLFKETKNGKDKGKKCAFMRRGAAIVTGDPSYYKKALKDGTFKPSKDDWDDAEDVYNEVMAILDATRLSVLSDIPSLEGIINGWYSVRNDKKMIKKIKNLPNEFNSVYEFMTPDYMDVRHTTSACTWKDRFKTAIENAYVKYC